MSIVESKLREHSKAVLVGLAHRANSQIYRTGVGESQLPTILVKWRGVGHAELTPLSDPVSPEDTREVARMVVERFHRMDSLIGLRRKITSEIQRRVHE